MDQAHYTNMDHCGPHNESWTGKHVTPVWFRVEELAWAADYLQLRVVILFGKSYKDIEFVRQANTNAPTQWPTVWLFAKTAQREWQAMPNEQVATIGSSIHWNLLTNDNNVKHFFSNPTTRNTEVPTPTEVERCEDKVPGATTANERGRTKT